MNKAGEGSLVLVCFDTDAVLRLIKVSSILANGSKALRIQKIKESFITK